MYARKPLPPINETTEALANSLGLTVSIQTLRYVRGWPEQSPRPYQLWEDGKFIAAYATHERLVDALNKRKLAR